MGTSPINRIFSFPPFITGVQSVEMGWKRADMVHPPPLHATFSAHSVFFLVPEVWGCWVGMGILWSLNLVNDRFVDRKANRARFVPLYVICDFNYLGGWLNSRIYIYSNIYVYIYIYKHIYIYTAPAGHSYTYGFQAFSNTIVWVVFAISTPPDVVYHYAQGSTICFQTQVTAKRAVTCFSFHPETCTKHTSRPYLQKSDTCLPANTQHAPITLWLFNIAMV